MKRRYGAGIAITAGAAAVYVLLARRWQLRWGATAQELAGPLPGDELIAKPDLTATRALTVRAPAARVWPWIAQLGQGRGGLYSYDFLENLIGCNIHSTDRVVPEWQDVKAGDQVGLHPRTPRSRWPPWTQGDGWCCAAGSRWGMPRPPSISPGPSPSSPGRMGRPGLSRGRDGPTHGAGHG